jgi:hypothetical protein
LAIVLLVIRITASPFVLFHLAIVLCVIQITASSFVPFHLAIILCVIRITAYGEAVGSCNLNDTQYNGQMKKDK